MFKILIIVSRILFFSLWFIVNFSFSESFPTQKYLSKEAIDTSIMRGFLLLNESADMAGVGFRHEQSIIQAKKIARELKEKAKGDPNSKYIIWKVSELEAQIYLEESDIINQQMRKRQLTINELVDKYNKEVGKWRPDFATLYRIYKNMLQVDVTKANELADSYNQRKRAISREVVYFLDKAILAGKVEDAQKELGYCLRNQLYLDISQSAYKNLEDRVEGLIEAFDTKPSIEKLISNADKHLGYCKIGDARKCLDSADNKFFTIKQNLPQSESIALSSALKKMRGKLSTLEDSLVTVNISILKKQGVNEADKYLQNVLRSKGVSIEKAAYVDKMIIATRTPNENSSKIVESLELDTTKESVIDDIMLTAKRKAKEKQDSLMLLNGTAVSSYENNEVINMGPIYSSTNDKASLKVDSITMEIYNLLENSKIKKANELYKKEKDFLEKYLGKEDFLALKSTLENFTEEPSIPSSNVYLVKPVEEKGQSIDNVSSPLEKNLLRAQKEIEGIYTMLEQNQIDRAYKRFIVNRSPLQKYLSPEVFNMLELSVTQAYQDYTSKKNKQGGRL